MRRISRRAVRLGLTAAVLTLGAGLLPVTATAQQSGGRWPLRADGEPERSPRVAKPRGFRLFGLADAAQSQIKTSSPTFYWNACTYQNSTGGSLDCNEAWAYSYAGPTDNTYFASIMWAWGAPPSTRTKILARNPGVGLASALGGGYAILTPELTDGTDVLLPTDNQLGNLFSGVQATQDRTCLDHTGGFVNAGTPLLAGSDCPQTWGSLGWQGRKPIDASLFLGRAQTASSLTAAEQVFDFWRLPEGDPSPDGKLERQFGTFQTYGEFSDYSKDEICGTTNGRTYGKAMAGSRIACSSSVFGSTPTRPGYPLGLKVRFDAFAYGIPSLADAVFYQATVTNNSAEVYGNGVDYDSLYIGLQPSPYSNNQRNHVYYRPELGALITTTTCTHLTPVCNGAVTAADLTKADVTPPSVGGNSFGPWELGSAALIMLKSPIGDLRNKLFTRTGSPFATAPVPQQIKDDTITFNHGHLCGFRACARTTFALDYKTNPDMYQRSFGMISSRDIDVLGVRTPSTLGGAVAGQILWHTFRSADFPAAPNVGTAATDFPKTGGFNRWVPQIQSGFWDYNNDGVADTLYLDTCAGKSVNAALGGTLSQACVGLFSDTMPHLGGADKRYLNGYSNTAGIMTVGPIKLKAGETTSFVVASTAVCCGSALDSTVIMGKVNAVVDHYMNFYLGPEPLPKDTIVGVFVQGGNSSKSQVTLTFTQTAENAADPYLLAQATKFLTATSGEDLANKELNPFLVDTLQALALPPAQGGLGNFEKLYVFKSCDGGATFTNNANCTPSPATGGAFAELGWLPYDVLDRDKLAAGRNTYNDPNVIGGTTYTYVLIGQSKGASLVLQTGAATQVVTDTLGNSYTVCTAGCKTQVVQYAPSLFNALATSGPNVAVVYVPASPTAASTSRSMATIRTVAGPIGAERITVTAAANRPRAGKYNLSFYDSVQVTVRDSVDAQLRSIRGTKTIVRAFRGTSLVFTDSSNTMTGGVGLQGGTVTDTRVRNSVGSTPDKIRETDYSFTSRTAILRGPGGATGTPVLVTSSFDANATPESFYSSAAFPGFRIAFDPAPALAFNTAYGEQFVGPDGTAISALTRPFVQLLRVNATQVAARSEGGRYEITWTDKPFGPNEPFHLDLANRARVDSIVNASLAARNVGTTGATTAAVAASIGAGTAASDLVPVKLPFTIVNKSYGDRPVTVAMKRRASNKLLLGRGADTVTVTVPDDQWIPGDQLYILEDTRSIAGTGLDVTFNPFILGCNTGISADVLRTSCNPVALQTTGSSLYISTRPGTKQSFVINPPLTNEQQFEIEIQPQLLAADLALACTTAGEEDVCAQLKQDIKNVKVAPNPYIAISNYADPLPGSAARPLLFTRVPPRGAIRIYTVSGQLVQQITWTPSDLNETGDLAWNLRTREGLEIAGGLYLFMVTGTDANGKELGQHMGKFVVIR